MARPGANHREVPGGDIAIWDAETIKRNCKPGLGQGVMETEGKDLYSAYSPVLQYSNTPLLHVYLRRKQCLALDCQN